MKYAFATAAVALVAALGGGAAMAQSQTFASPDEAIKFRQATLKELGQNFKAIADMAGGRAAFDAAKADSSTTGTVGRPGSTMPTRPRPRLV